MYLNKEAEHFCSLMPLFDFFVRMNRRLLSFFDYLTLGFLCLTVEAFTLHVYMCLSYCLLSVLDCIAAWLLSLKVLPMFSLLDCISIAVSIVKFVKRLYAN